MLSVWGGWAKRIGLVAFASISLGSQCTSHNLPPNSETERKLDAELESLIQAPESWPQRLERIEFLLQKSRPRSAEVAGQLRADALALTEQNGSCAAWVNTFVSRAAGQLVNGKTSIDVDNYYCPVLPEAVAIENASSAVTVYGFTRLAPRLPGALFRGNKEQNLKPSSIGNARVVFTPPPCRAGSMDLIFTGRDISTVKLTLNTVPEKDCGAKAASMLSTLLSGCTNECCDFADTNKCIKDRCDAECSSRVRTNPAGHPAIGDACSESGEYYKWCHSKCREIEHCRKDWCSDAAPLRQACLVESKALHEAQLAKCPRVSKCDQ